MTYSASCEGGPWLSALYIYEQAAVGTLPTWMTALFKKIKRTLLVCRDDRSMLIVFHRLFANDVTYINGSAFDDCLHCCRRHMTELTKIPESLVSGQLNHYHHGLIDEGGEIAFLVIN
jgi:hypothetical protein